MALDKRTATWYRVKCDRCGAWAPESLAQEEAILLAQEEDWQTVSWWNGLSYVRRDFCPDCYEEWEREQEAKAEKELQGWEEAKAQQFQGQEPEEA